MVRWLSACVLVSGCAVDAERDFSRAPRVTVCLAGAFQLEDGANPLLEAFCDRQEGVLPFCPEEGGACRSMWPIGAIPVDSLEPDDSVVYTALFGALDVDGDGLLTDLDAPRNTSVVGYSWGGINASKLSIMLASDPRVQTSWAPVRQMVILDPFLTTHPEGFDVAASVDRAWIYRHSLPPLNGRDCSNGAPFGPYVGLQPHCEEGVDCADHDYALQPDDRFPTAEGGSMPGGNIGHCSLLQVALIPADANLLGEDGVDIPSPMTPPTR